MDKVKELADELYNQKVLDGWKNVSMETCLKRATDYYRMDKVVKKLTIPDVSQQRELLKFFSAQLSENLDIDVGMNYITEEDIEECLKNFNCG